MSDYRGIQDQDPAERLAAALNRIAVGVERREAAASAARALTDTTSQADAESWKDYRPPVPAESPVLPAVVVEIDALVSRLRHVLSEWPPVSGSQHDGGS